MATDGAHGFDFLLGRWDYRLQRLSRPFDPDCDEWFESHATGEAVSVLDGLGNFDQLHVATSAHSDGFSGATLRLYDPAGDTWRIWWMSSRTPGVLDDPVVGRFDGTRGLFECDEQIDGELLHIRYTWLADDPAEPRFEQSYSRDGQTWIPNWITTQRRAAPA